MLAVPSRPYPLDCHAPRSSNRIHIIGRSIGRANRQERLRLRIGGDTPVLRLERVRIRGGRPMMYERIMLVLHRLGRGHTCGGAGLVAAHRATRSIACETLVLARCGAAAAHILRLDPGTRVMELERIVRTVGKLPREWRHAIARLPP